jgi:CheY-like chemotaxis protein
MRILLADDQDEIRLLAKHQLESSGHSVVAVANGEEALQALRNHTFDLVFLDEEMPRMPGTEVLRVIRRDEKKAHHLVVIALTGYNTDTDKERLLKVGFDAVIGKPFRLDALEPTLRAAMSGEFKMPEASLEPLEASSNDPLAKIGGDKKLLQSMARTFLKELPARMEKIEKSVRQKNGKELAFEAHALRGSLSLFAADQAAALCRELQQYGKDNRFVEVPRTVDALKEAIAELESNLRGYAGQNRTSSPDAPSKAKRRPADSK